MLGEASGCWRGILCNSRNLVPKSPPLLAASICARVGFGSGKRHKAINCQCHGRSEGRMNERTRMSEGVGYCWGCFISSNAHIIILLSPFLTLRLVYYSQSLFFSLKYILTRSNCQFCTHTPILLNSNSKYSVSVGRKRLVSF